MSSGLLALLDDVASLAKVAAASVDDVAGMAMKAGAKSAGVVIDDAAVTPRYVVGFAAQRELPIILKITKGSLRNKLLFLLPGALVLSLVAPWLITPLLMLGGLFLCFEGAEKVLEWVGWHQDHAEEEAAEAEPGTPKQMEDQRVASAIKTDFILSAEIMAITLAALPEVGFVQQAAVLAVVGVGITFLVYGAVALIVKADDFGVHLANRETLTPLGPASQAFGRGLVRAMPFLLKLLSTIGTLAMLLVGGGIVLHGLEVLGLAGPAHLVHGVAAGIAHVLPAAGGFFEWLVESAITLLVGLGLGVLLIPLVTRVLVPVVSRFTGSKSVEH
jgi:predicted DNA repair protein MutK